MPLGGPLGPISGLTGPLFAYFGPSGPRPEKGQKKVSRVWDFWSHFGLIFGLICWSVFRPRFWRPFGKDFSQLLDLFGTELALKIDKKR